MNTGRGFRRLSRYATNAILLLGLLGAVLVPTPVNAQRGEESQKDRLGLFARVSADPPPPPVSEPKKAPATLTLLQAAGLVPVPLLADDTVSEFRQGPPEKLLSRPMGMMSGTTVTIEYVAAGSTNTWGDSCVEFPAEAQAAFQYGADLWGAMLNSPVPIVIEACWASLPTGVLGHSGATNYYYNFSGAPESNTFYPVTLANALHGSDLYPGTADISIAYSKDFSYYFGTDRNPGLTQYDFVTLVLHEITHGLGFSGTMSVSSGSGSWGWGYNIPAAYDHFTSYGADGTSLINTGVYPNPSSNLGTALTSNNIYFNGSSAKAANGGSSVPLYAPATWAGGSSYSHLAEVYNSTANALMTYSLSKHEANHDPGPVTLGVLSDIGWPASAATPPAAPSGLSASATTYARIDLSWTDNSSDETGFRIERSADGTSGWSVVGSVGAGQTTYSNGGLTCSTPYYYRVKAYNGLESTPSNVANAITVCPSCVDAYEDDDMAVSAKSFTPNNPAESHNFDAVGDVDWVKFSATSGYQYTLETSNLGTYNDTKLYLYSTDGATKISENDDINYSQGNYASRIVWTAPGNGTYYAKAQYWDLSEGGCDGYTYDFRITAVLPPNAPSGLTATAASMTQINLSWTDNSSDETSFKIQRSVNGGSSWSDLTSTAANVTSYNNTSLNCGTPYTYRVAAVKSSLTSAYSSPAAATTSACPPVPAAPSDLQATTISASEIDLSWKDNSDNETGFKLERSVDNSTWNTLTTTNPNVKFYADTSLPERRMYYYRVSALNGLSESGDSNTSSALSYFATYLPAVTRASSSPTAITDPSYASQWNLSKISASAAWASGDQGAGVTVAVIDTGVNMTHPDLQANLLAGGYDFVDNDSNPEDEQGHGSHVSGIVAAAINGVGVVGVAPQAKILPVRVLDASGSGTYSQIASGITYAADRAHVLNLSLGGIYDSVTVRSAINYAIDTRGRVVVAAAGNCGGSNYSVNGCTYQNQPSYPAAYTNVLAVAATDSSDVRAYYSNQGSYLAVAAPGSSIYSTYKYGGYAYGTGTSQAAPHVAGQAALVWARNPGYTAAQVRSVITGTAQDLGSTGWDTSYGYGRINAYAAAFTSAAASVRSTDGPSAASAKSQKIARGQILVSFEPALSTASQQSLLSAFNGVSVERSLPGLDIQVLSVPKGEEWSMIERLNQLPGVRFAEPDGFIQLDPLEMGGLDGQ